jgi:hypothetical protein
VDETGSRLESSVTHTWGLRGQTPVLDLNSARAKINVMGGLSWDGQVFAQVTTEKVTGEDTIAFLKYVLSQ